MIVCILTLTCKFLKFVCIVPHPDVSITGHLPPYIGTIFNLTGTIQLGIEIVSTNITITWVWTRGEKTLETHNTTRCYQSTITFQPLTTYSSGLYNLQVTLRSTTNSEYIVESHDSAFYRLTVQRKLELDYGFK